MQKLLDFLTFPIRGLTLFHTGAFGLTSLADERFDFVASETRGLALDIGCGRQNRFIAYFLGGRGRGIDIFPYEGLRRENIVTDLKNLPFASGSFDTVTFIANLNHCPERDRDTELVEAFRVLRPGGRIIITMGNPLAEIAVHKVVWAYDKLLGTTIDMDNERGMQEGEAYFLTDGEVLARLGKAGFTDIRKRYFWTQWFLNHMFIALKPL